MSMGGAILVVDDEVSVRGLLRSVLQRDGFEVHVAANAHEAFEVLQRVDFDAVLADVVMPGMDGVMLLEEIRKVDTDLPVLLMTGYGTLDTAVDAMRRGATDYIAKPFKCERLLDSLGRALSGRKLGNSIRDTLESEERTHSTIQESVFDSALEKHMTLRELGDRYIERILSLSRGNKVHAARVLGINRRTLYRRGNPAKEREN